MRTDDHPTTRAGEVSAAASAEWHRLLRPGGTLLLSGGQWGATRPKGPETAG